jgi:hypothetical protein
MWMMSSHCPCPKRCKVLHTTNILRRSSCLPRAVHPLAQPNLRRRSKQQMTSLMHRCRHSKTSQQLWKKSTQPIKCSGYCRWMVSPQTQREASKKLFCRNSGQASTHATPSAKKQKSTSTSSAICSINQYRDMNHINQPIVAEDYVCGTTVSSTSNHDESVLLRTLIASYRHLFKVNTCLLNV